MQYEFYMTSKKFILHSPPVRICILWLGSLTFKNKIWAGDKQYMKPDGYHDKSYLEADYTGELRVVIAIYVQTSFYHMSRRIQVTETKEYLPTEAE